MLHLNITDEISRLKTVVLGTAKSSGPTPKKYWQALIQKKRI